MSEVFILLSVSKYLTCVSVHATSTSNSANTQSSSMSMNTNMGIHDADAGKPFSSYLYYSTFDVTD